MTQTVEIDAGGAGVFDAAGPWPPRHGELGIVLADLPLRGAVRWLERLGGIRDGRARVVFFVHAHTLNLEWKSPAYRERLNSAYAAF